jgi:YVTN family beta-propeller protein
MARQGTVMRWVRGVVVVGLAGALVGVLADAVSAVPARRRCRATAFVTNSFSNTVSTIDVQTRTKHPSDIPVAKAVQSRLGHASAAEALDTYSHLWPDSDDRTRDAVDSAWRDARVSLACHERGAKGR